MIFNDQVLGKPLKQYSDTKTNITALPSLLAGETAYATDTYEFGLYTGSAWVWSTLSGGVSAHASLTQLDYASAGHTGFQATLSFPLATTSGGTGVNNAGTITNAVNTTITGGGTLALAGFTLTVPATGTAALLATLNIFTTTQTFSFGALNEKLKLNTTDSNGYASQINFYYGNVFKHEFGAVRTAGVYYLRVYDASGKVPWIMIPATGKMGVNCSPTAQLHVQGDATVIGIQLDAGGAVSAVFEGVHINGDSNGAAQAGFGVRLQYALETSTTANTNAAAWDVLHVVATHASRTERIVGYVNDAAGEREWIRGEASGSAAMIGFLGHTAIIQQTSGADLTNNVTAGGTTDQIDDFTNLTVYATDAAAIRNDIYQLSKKLKQVNDSLRLYGLLS